MRTRRTPIRFFEHERKMLVEQYLRWRIPIDQFDARPVDRAAFLAEWRALSKRADTWEELIHYMKNERKSGKWPKLNGTHQPTPPTPEVTADQTEILVRIFEEEVTMHNKGSDSLSYDQEIAILIAKEFEAEAGLYFAPDELVAKLTALRKRGLLTRVSEVEKHGEQVGFDDIDNLAN